MLVFNFGKDRNLILNMNFCQEADRARSVAWFTLVNFVAISGSLIGAVTLDMLDWRTLVLVEILTVTPVAYHFIRLAFIRESAQKEEPRDE